MDYVLTGIVIRSVPYNESDVLLTVLSNSGKHQVYCRSVLKSKKSNIHAQLFSYGDYEITEGKNKFPLCTGSSVRETFYGLRNTLPGMYLGQYLLEVCSLVPDSDDTSDYLSLLLNSLYLITKEKIPLPVVKLVFELMFSRFSGILPDPSVCGKCGGSPAYWDFENGFLCSSCVPPFGAHEVNQSVLKAIGHISESDGYAKYMFSMDDGSFLNLCSLSEKYISDKFETAFPSLKYYHDTVC